MSRALRLVMVCLLVVTLPFKAIAGLAMPAWTGTSHEATTMPVHGEPASPPGGLHDPAAIAQADCHGAVVADDAAPQHHGNDGGKCGSCSPCSVATGPAPAFAVALESLPAHQGVARPSAPHAGVVADVPHEPPRSSPR